VEVYRSLIPASCMVLAMVKASSYGSGAVKMAQYLQKIGINYFFVSLCRHTQTMARSCLDTKLNYFFFLICCFQKLLNGGIKVKDYFQFKDV